MTAHKLSAIVAQSGEFKALSRRVQRLAEIERLLFETVPLALSKAARLNGIRAGVLLVSTDNSAAAAKLRQLAPRLLMHVTEREPKVTGIRVDVQPLAGPAAAVRSEKQAMGPEVVAQISRLAASLPESSLKTALARMAGRRRRT